MYLIAHNQQELVCTPESGLCSPFLVTELLLSVLPSVLQLSPRENELFYDVVAIVDPLTRAAQKMSTLLIVSYLPVSLFHSVNRGYKGKCIRHEHNCSCTENDLVVLGNKDVCFF